MNATLSADATLADLPAHDDAEWLADRRAASRDRLARTGFPAKAEEWKGTDVAAFVQPRRAPTPDDAVTAVDIEHFCLRDVRHCAVMVDGRFRADLSRLDDLPHNVHVESLATATQRGSPVLNEHLNAMADDAFADWNMAAWTDGVFVTTGANVQFKEPVHILHVRSPEADTVCFPRVLVHLRENAQLQIVEHHAGIGEAPTATIAVTELVAHDGATLRHDRIQEANHAALHLHGIWARADRDAQILRGDACLGGARSRLTVHGKTAGTGAHIGLNGFFLTGGDRRTDVWTRFDHAVPHTTSQELVKGVLGDSARGRFTGNVLVRKDAQKTSAEQENRNLLLSKKALVDAQPQLEIHADDVQCSHGSTVGQLDPDALFFLRARGIGESDARLLLTKAFLGEAVEAMNPILRDALDARIEAWFERHPQMELVA